MVALLLLDIVAESQSIIESLTVCLTNLWISWLRLMKTKKKILADKVE
jgi:hypothetical protein